MVKNSIGGNKAKRQGRKFVGTVSSKLRVSMEDGEIYAVVTKLLGNAMIDVLCIDGTQRICIIRNKFRGRSKQDNCIKLDSWIVVGVREWEVRQDKESKCDLIAVYDERDKEYLKSQNIERLKPLYKELDEKEKELENVVHFVRHQEVDIDIENEVNSEEEEDINFDDI